MQAIIESILKLGTENITMIFNLVLAAVGVFAIIGFIIGMIRGIYRESFSFLIFGVCYLLIILFNSKITNYAYDMDISWLTSNFNINLQYNTLGANIEGYVSQALVNMGITMENSPEFTATVTKISYCLLNVVVYIVLAIVMLVVAELLDVLLYNVCFKFFISKNRRKKHKVRWAGGLIAAVKSVLIFCLLLSPFSAILNTIISSMKNNDNNTETTNGKEVDNPTYQALMSILDGYNNSYLAQLLFSISSNGGKTLDVGLMNYITNYKDEDGNIYSFYSELGDLGPVAVTAIKNGLVTSTYEIDQSVIVVPEVMGQLFSYLASSTLAQTILSLGATIACNSDQVKNTVDLTNVNFYDVDWSSSITAVGDVLLKLQEANILSDVMNNSDYLNSFELSGDKANNVVEALELLDGENGNDLLNKVIPSVCASYVKKYNEKANANNTNENVEGLKKSDTPENDDTSESTKGNSIVLPAKMENTDFYENILWGKELSSLFSVLRNIAVQYDAYYKEPLTISKLGNMGDVNVIYNTMFATELFPRLESDTKYSQRFERNVFVNGGNYSYQKNEEEVTVNLPGTKEILGTTKNSNGLLDLQVLKKLVDEKILGDIVSQFDVDSLLGLDKNESIKNELTNVFDSLDTIDKWKNEFGAIVDVAQPAVELIKSLNNNSSSNEEPSGKKKAQSSTQSSLDVVLEKENIECLQQISDVAINSKIVDKLLPQVLEDYCQQKDADLVFGLKLSSLNFTYFPDENDTFMNQLGNLVDSLANISNDLVPFIDDLTNSEDKISAITSDCAKNLDGDENTNSIFSTFLNILHDNQIFNKKVDYTTEDDNFTTIMLNLFTTQESSSGEESNDINLPNLTNGMISVDKDVIKSLNTNTSWTWKNEINGITNFIGSLNDTEIITYIVNDSGSDITTKIFSWGDDVEKVLSTIDNTKLIKNAAPKLLQDTVGEAIVSYFGNDGEDNSSIKPIFDENMSWAKEGTNLKNMLNAVNVLTDGGNNTNLDFTTLATKGLEYDTYEKYIVVYPDATKDDYNDYFDENVNSSSLTSFLKSLSETQSIGKANPITNDGQKDTTTTIFTNILKKLINDGIKNVDDTLDIETCAQKDLITDDFNLRLNGNETDITWDDEICNIVKVVNSLTNFTSSDSSSISSYTPVLKKVNECFILRDVLCLLIDSKIKTFISSSSTSNSMINDIINKANFEAFHQEELSCTPYDENNVVTISKKITTREQEVNQRAIEIDCLVDLLDSADKVAQVDLSDLSNLNPLLKNKSLTSNEEDGETSVIENMLIAMQKSKLFNEIKGNKANRSTDEDLTAFEYAFQMITSQSSDFLKKVKAETLIDITNGKEGLSWLDVSGKQGEIKTFNDALYNTLNSDVVSSLINSDEEFDIFDDKYWVENKTPILDIVDDLSSTPILQDSLALLLDKNVVSTIFTNVKDDTKEYTGTIEDLYQKISTCYFNYYELGDNPDGYAKIKDYWNNEGTTLDTLVKSIKKIYKDGSIEFTDLTTLVNDYTPEEIASGAVIGEGNFNDICSAIYSSLTLNYLDIKKFNVDVMSNAVSNEIKATFTDSTAKSVYQLIISKLINVTDSKISETFKDDYVKSSTNEILDGYMNFYLPDNTSSYRNDELNMERAIYYYNHIDSLLTNQNFSTLSDDDISNINNLLNCIKESYSMNYAGLKENIKEDKSDHYIYEEMIMMFEDNIQNSIVNALFKDDSTTSEFNYKVSSYIDSYSYEQNVLMELLANYSSCSTIFENDSLSVSDINDDSIDSMGLVLDNFSLSHGFNNKELSTKTVENSYSIYQHIVMKMINITNTAMENALNLDTTMADDPKSILNFAKEKDIILDAIRCYNKLSSNLSGGKVSMSLFDMEDKTKGNEFLTNLEEFLSVLYGSDVYNYTMSIVDDTQKGRVIGTSGLENVSDLSIFEQTIYRLLTSTDIQSKIYDSDNINQLGLDSGEKVIAHYIKNVTNESYKDKYTNENAEIIWMKTNKTEEDGFTLLSGELKTLHNIILNYGDYNNISSSGTSLSEYISEDNTGLINKINSSYIFHDLVPKMVKEFSNNANIQNLLVNTHSYNDYYYKIETSNYKFDERVSKWNGDLFSISKALDDISTITTQDDALNLRGLDIFENLLSNLGNTITFNSQFDVVGKEYKNSILSEILVKILVDEVAITYNSSKLYLGVLLDGSTYVEKLDTINSIRKAWNIEGQGLDLFLGDDDNSGIGLFVNEYSKYYVNKYLTPTPYPEFPVTDATYSIAYHMSNNLVNVFPE